MIDQVQQADGDQIDGALLVAEVLGGLETQGPFTLAIVRSLGIVRRELAAGEDHQRLLAAERDRLNVGELAALAPELRSGARHPADGDLRASLRRVVEAKVAVARPDHFERRIPPFDPVTDS